MRSSSQSRPDPDTLHHIGWARRNGPGSSLSSAARRCAAIAFTRDGAIGAAVALALAGVLWLADRTQANNDAGVQRDRLQLAVNLAASVVQADLRRSLASADTLDAMLRNDGAVEPFERVVGELRERFPLLATVTLAPGAVVRQVSPSEVALTFTGMRLLDLAGSRNETRQALRNRSMTVGVANDGKQGSYITGYQPVYRRGGRTEAGQSGVFWGFVTVSVRLPKLDDYLAAARLDTTELLAELVYLDSQSQGWTRLTESSLGDASPVVTADVELPGRTLLLRIAPRPAWRATNWTVWLLVGGSLLAGVLCTAALQRRRRLALRRLYFETSQILAGWSEQFDAAHASLDVLRRTTGMAAVVVVRLPAVGTFQRAGAVVPRGEQRDWSGLIRSFKRSDDMLIHLHGNDFLLAAHSLSSQAVAARVRQRLLTQLQDLTAHVCGAETLPVFLDSMVFDPDVNDPGTVLAKLLVALHSGEPRARRSAALHPPAHSRLSKLL